MFSFLKRHYTAESISDEQIAALEREHNLELPLILKEFYRNHSGVPIHPVTFTINGTQFTVTKFIPLFSGSMPVEHILDLFRLCGRFPEGFFPLAVSETGDDYFLDTRTDEIYWVSMDQPHRPKRLMAGLERFFDLLESSYHSQKETRPRFHGGELKTELGSRPACF